MVGHIKMSMDEKAPCEQTMSCNHSASMPGLSSIIHSSLSSTSLSLSDHTLPSSHMISVMIVLEHRDWRNVCLWDSFLRQKLGSTWASLSVYLSVDLPMHACNTYLLSCCYQALSSIIYTSFDVYHGPDEQTWLVKMIQETKLFGQIQISSTFFSKKNLSPWESTTYNCCLSLYSNKNTLMHSYFCSLCYNVVCMLVSVSVKNGRFVLARFTAEPCGVEFLTH